MIELRLHRDLYDGAAVKSLPARFGQVAELDVSLVDNYWVVTVAGGNTESQLLGEIGNFALGLTIEKRCGPESG